MSKMWNKVLDIYKTAGRFWAWFLAVDGLMIIIIIYLLFFS